MDSILTVTSVSKSFRKVQALKNVSLKVKKGEIFGLIGPDGAGKSTLIYIIGGLLRPNDGSVTLLENDMLKDPEVVKPHLGILPQGLGLSLAAELSIEENVNYFAEINSVDPKKRETLKTDLLEVTKLMRFKDRAAKNLSGGMKQKLGICCTLIHSPKMVFLDEPTTGVDPISRRDIWYLINKILKENDITIFLTTSYMDEAERCHRMALMHLGEVVAMGDINDLTRQIDGRLIEIYVDDQQKALGIFKNMEAIKVIYPAGIKLNAIYSGQEAAGDSIKSFGEAHDIKVNRIEEVVPTLEDVFLSKIMKQAAGFNQEALEEFYNVPGKTQCRKSSDDIMIEVKNLYKIFGNYTAVDNVSFDVKRGEIFGFLGPNGAGKTTTIKMLCGLFPPTKGSGKISSFDIMKEQWKIKENIGYMSQKFSLYRDLTVGENIELYAGIYGVPESDLQRRKELILKVADLEGKGDIITDSLPMGIKQRLALGCAIIHQPEVIFLDEPTSGVDPIARRIFWDIIFYLSQKICVTILVTTHYMDEAEQCNRISLMHMGRLIALGASLELKKKVTAEIGLMLEILTTAPFESYDILGRHFGFCNIFGRTIHLYTRDGAKDEGKIRQLLSEQKIEVLDMREKLMPFEDVFVYFCEKAEKGEI
ncbi:MAG: ATP-binding cassette domain-containing protein [Candidatus Eremiobacteraeota bacterium]|nr:ATP-binding cassette domain-containing protein [Candidatus Eremiobacteraeota bacterium]